MDTSDPNRVKPYVNMDDADAISLDILELLEDEEISTGAAAAALALSLARVIRPDELTPAIEIGFVQAVIEFSGTYFADGVIN